MNLRILKKLSKRAAPMLMALGDNRKQFCAERYDNYTKLLILERKHFERFRSVHGQLLREREIKQPAKDGHGWVGMAPPSHPRKGTIMVGAVSGYYEPEWDEETAWEALCDLVYWSSADFDVVDDIDDVRITLRRRLDTPADYFAAARTMMRSESAKT